MVAILMAGNPITVQRVYEVEFANRFAGLHEVLNEALELARDIASCVPLAVAAAE